MAREGYSEPEPDVAVVTGAMRDYWGSRATSEVLVVEVSNESLHLGWTVKQYLSARCGIPEYCLLALPDARLEVYRDLAGDGYRSVVAALVRPDAQIVVVLIRSSTYFSL